MNGTIWEQMTLGNLQMTYKLRLLRNDKQLVSLPLYFNLFPSETPTTCHTASPIDYE